MYGEHDENQVGQNGANAEDGAQDGAQDAAHYGRVANAAAVLISAIGGRWA
jgi:hypothetical protein